MFMLRSYLLFSGLALALGACSHRPNTASRTPDATLQNGTPEGDHTGSDPTRPRNEPHSAGASEGPEVPGPDYSGTRQDPLTPQTGDAAGPNGAAPSR